MVLSLMFDGFRNYCIMMMIFRSMVCFFWYLMFNTVLLRFELISNLIKFQSRTPLEDVPIKLDDHFEKEKCIIGFFIVFNVLLAG